VLSAGLNSGWCLHFLLVLLRGFETLLTFKGFVLHYSNYLVMYKFL
jgi:hypothetical protein